MNRFVLKNTFIKIYIYHFLINIFIKNKKSELYFGDCVAVQNDLNYQYGGSIKYYVIKGMPHSDRRTESKNRTEITESILSYGGMLGSKGI